MKTEVKALQAADRAAWQPLARGYKLFDGLTHHSNTAVRALYDRVAVNKGFIRYDLSL